MRLHVDTSGLGPPAVFIHGIFSWGLDTFAAQQGLADAYRLLIVDRVGFGQTPRESNESAGWPVDGPATIEVLESVGPAHLVGHSYGAVVALLVASVRPDLVRSLVLIEPLLFDVAASDPGVKPVRAAFRRLAALAPDLTAREFRVAFRAATGLPPDPEPGDPASMSEADWRAIDNSRHEAWPGDAPIDFRAIARQASPKVLAIGTAPVTTSREPTRAAFRAVAREIAKRIGGRVAEFDGSTHDAQRTEPDRFNELLREVWRKA